MWENLSYHSTNPAFPLLAAVDEQPYISRWVSSGSDILIALAFIAISSILLYFARRRALPNTRRLILFALFILACGIAHFLESLQFRYPVFTAATVMKLMTAALSWGALLALIPLIPRLLEPVATSSRPFSGTGIGDTTLHSLASTSKYSRLNDYIVAVAVSLLVLLCRAVMEPIVENDYLFVLALLGVVIVSWRSGFGPGVATLLLSMIGMVFFFVPPRYSFKIEGYGNQLAASMFLFCGACCAGLGEAQWIARRRAKAALTVALERKADLEVEVARRREAEFSIRQNEIELIDVNRKLAVSQVQTATALAQVESLVHNAPLGIALLDPTMQIVQVNRVFADMTERPIPDHIGVAIRTISPIFPSELIADIERVSESGTASFDPRLVTQTKPNHKSMWQMTAFPVLGVDGRAIGVGLISQDVTEQLAADRQLRASESRYRTLTEAIPQLVWNAAPDGRASYFNKRWFDFTGLSFEQSQGWGWLEAIHPDDREVFRHEWKEAIARKADAVAAEFRLRRGSEGSYRWMLADVISQRDHAGSIIEWIGSIGDIDDRKQQAEKLERMVTERTVALSEEVEERKKIEHQLRAIAVELNRSNKELEQFAYIASHDLQEPLRKIQAFGDRLKTKFADALPDIGKDYVERMHNSAARMRRLIEDLLTFSRVTTQARPFGRVDLGKLAIEVTSDLDEYIEQNGAEVEIGNLPAIDADSTQMRQLFQNLIANAIKFHRADVVPRVAISAETADDSVCRIRFRDNGIGFDEKYLGRIFQVFQRLHGREEYQGTGVGLAICRKIAERHGGSITAQSQVDEGSTFIVTLPVHHPAEEALTDARTDQELSHHLDGR